MTETTLATPGERADYDVLKAEVHRKAMEEIAMEMGITLVRTSGSPVVTEAKDLSCSVLDDKVEQIGFSSYVGLHISTSFLGIRALLENYDLDDIAPGDAFMVNDPHTSGALHEGDVGVIMPYYYDGELVAWGYVNEHTIDVGGSGVSGFAASARDCFSEGLRFPALRFMREGAISPEWRMFIGNNVRAPSAVLNDLRSMVAAVNTGDRRLRALIDRMGLEQHREFCEINKGLSERIVRQRIAALPDGRYQSTDWVEYDGLGEPLLLEVSCTMDVAGDELKLSFRGESQIAGPINGAPPAVLGQSMNTLQCVLLHDVPANAGLWRPIDFDLGPTGTVVNSVPPAPVCFAHVGTGMRIDKLVRDVLAQAASLSPDESVRSRVSSQPCEGIFLTTLAGVDRRSGQPTVVFPVAPTVGLGGPAQTTGDGQDTYSNTCNLGIGMAAVEIDESSSPVLIHWRRIQPSSGGAGMTRGGNGMTTALPDPRRRHDERHRQQQRRRRAAARLGRRAARLGDGLPDPVGHRVRAARRRGQAAGAGDDRWNAHGDARQRDRHRRRGRPVPRDERRRRRARRPAAARPGARGPRRRGRLRPRAAGARRLRRRAGPGRRTSTRPPRRPPGPRSGATGSAPIPRGRCCRPPRSRWASACA